MSLLDQFEEKKVDDISVPGDQVPGTEESTNLEKMVEDLKKDYMNLSDLTRAKIAEFNLESARFKDEKEQAKQYLEDSSIIVEKLYKEMEDINLKQKQSFIKILDELKDQNTLFMQTLKNEKIIEGLTDRISNDVKSINKSIVQAIAERNDDIENELNRVERHIYSFNSIYAKLWYILIALFIGVFGVAFYYNSKINTMNEKFRYMENELYNSIAMFKGQKQFWYSKEDYDSYLSDLKKIKKYKENEKKKKK